MKKMNLDALLPSSRARRTRMTMLVPAAILASLLVGVPTVFLSSGGTQKATPVQNVGKQTSLAPYVSQAVAFMETKPLGEIKQEPLSREEFEKIESKKEEIEKNIQNVKSVKRPIDPNKTGKF